MSVSSENSPPLPSAHGLALEDWTAWMRERGESAFRAKQVLDWLFAKRVESFDRMTNLPPALRATLAAAFDPSLPPAVLTTGSTDTTRKHLFRLRDGRLIETVRIPANVHFNGERSSRITLCVSSQVGCAYDCKFCASGLAGFVRNLEPGEIVGQVLAAEALGGEPVRNLVFMGMGEPLANYSRLTKAIEILNAHWGANIGARHITVSTSGLAPQIERLALFPVPVRLAVSLHGATDEVRERIMPVNRKYPILRLFEALETWADHRKQFVTFEYILIEGVNDDLEQAALLARHARRLRAKVNLIPYNTVAGLPWRRPEELRLEAFLEVLVKAGAKATLRREKGHDIEAACGQLRLREEGMAADEVLARPALH